MARRPCAMAARIALGLGACIALGLGLAALAAQSACSPYDPSLPSTPFLCADDEPRCPDGYVCVGEPDGRKVCHAEGTVDAGVVGAATSR